MVKGRFNFLAYFSLLFTLAFFCSSLYLIFHPQLTLKGKGGFTLPAPIVGCIILLLTAFLFYVLGKVIYLVSITDNTIKITGVFKRRLLDRFEIKSIDLLSWQNFYWSAGSTTIGTQIELVTGEKIIIADPFYSNIAVIKQTIAENFKEKILDPSQKSVKKSNSLTETDFEKFAGNPHTSFNGIMLYSMLIFHVILLLTTHNLQAAHWFLLFPFIIFFLGFGYQLNYFLVSNHRVVVKNHALFWVNKHYDINDIAAVNLEIHSKRSTALRITSKNFKSKLYAAGSLRDANWIALRQRLEKCGINYLR